MHDAFLKAVIDNPEDDTPRLVYADWLDERDDPRGEFIRVQVELAKSTGGNAVLLHDAEVKKLTRRDESYSDSIARVSGIIVAGSLPESPRLQVAADIGKVINPPTVFVVTRDTDGQEWHFPKCVIDGTSQAARCHFRALPIQSNNARVWFCKGDRIANLLLRVQELIRSDTLVGYWRFIDGLDGMDIRVPFDWIRRGFSETLRAKPGAAEAKGG